MGVNPYMVHQLDEEPFQRARPNVWSCQSLIISSPVYFSCYKDFKMLHLDKIVFRILLSCVSKKQNKTKKPVHWHTIGDFPVSAGSPFIPMCM